MRSGKGKCTWMDGTYYDGNWVANKRQGQGEFKMFNGYYYNGGWTNDIKDGRGNEIDEEGNKSATTWAFGLRDGAGTYIKKGGLPEQVIFHEGIICHAPTNTSIACSTDCYGCDIFRCLLFYGCIIAGVVLKILPDNTELGMILS